MYADEIVENKTSNAVGKYALTHRNVDVDAVVSTYLLSKLAGYRVVLDVNDIPNNAEVVVVDMPITKQILSALNAKNCTLLGVLDHHSGEDYTCAAEAVAEFLKLNPDSAYKYLIELAESCDCGLILSEPEYLRLFHISGILAVMRFNGKSDYEILEEMYRILDMYIPYLEELLEAERIVEAIPVISVGGYSVAVVNKPTNLINQVLFNNKEVDLIIYKDRYNLGIIRNAEIDMPDLSKLKSIILELLEAKGKKEEINEWFFHPDGFITARGTRKHPAKTPSVLGTNDLLKALLMLMNPEFREKSGDSNATR